MASRESSPNSVRKDVSSNNRLAMSGGCTRGKYAETSVGLIFGGPLIGQSPDMRIHNTSEACKISGDPVTKGVRITACIQSRKARALSTSATGIVNNKPETSLRMHLVGGITPAGSTMV